MQLQFRRAQAVLGGIDGAVGYYSDVADAQLAFDLQQIGLSLVAGQLSDRLAERARGVLTRRGPTRLRCGAGLRGPTSKRVDHPIVRKGEQSGLESSGRFQAGNISRQRKPDLLQQLVGCCLAADIALEIAPDTELVSPVELIERRSVVARIASNQSLVALFGIGHADIIATQQFLLCQPEVY